MFHGNTVLLMIYSEFKFFFPVAPKVSPNFIPRDITVKKGEEFKIVIPYDGNPIPKTDWSVVGLISGSIWFITYKNIYFPFYIAVVYFLLHIPFHRVGDLLPKVVVWVLRIPPMKSNWSIRQQRSQILANTMLFYPMKRALILPQSTSMLLVSCLQPNVIICWFNLVVFMQMVQNIWISSWVFLSDFQTHLTSLKDPWRLEASPPTPASSHGMLPRSGLRSVFSYFLFTHLLCTKEDL